MYMGSTKIKKIKWLEIKLVEDQNFNQYLFNILDSHFKYNLFFIKYISLEFVLFFIIPLNYRLYFLVY